MTRIVPGPQINGEVVSKTTGAPLSGVTVTPSTAVYTDRELTAAVTTLTTDGTGGFAAYAKPGVYTFTLSDSSGVIPEPVEVVSSDQGTVGVVPAVSSFGNTESRVLSMQPALVGAGPFVLSYMQGTFASTADPTVAFGYNCIANGTPAKAAENQLGLKFEANYNDGSGHIKMEAYDTYYSSSGSVEKRAQFMQWQKDNDALVAHSLMGHLTNGLTVTKDDGTVTGATVLAITSSGLVFTPSGGLGVHSAALYVNATQVLTVYDTPGGAAGAAISVGISDNSAVGVFGVGASNTAVKGVIIRARASQSGNMFEVQDDGSVARIYVTKGTTLIAPSLVVGNAALATTATDGFLYVPTFAGTPTGVPTTRTGTAALGYDTTNNKLAVYNSGWKQVTLA